MKRIVSSLVLGLTLAVGGVANAEDTDRKPDAPRTRYSEESRDAKATLTPATRWDNSRLRVYDNMTQPYTIFPYKKAGGGYTRVSPFDSNVRYYRGHKGM